MGFLYRIHCHCLLTAGADYTTVTFRITFAAGDTRVSIPVDTIDNDVAELPEDFSALLSNPSEGLAIGAQDTATVTITDDESKQSITRTTKVPFIFPIVS